MPTTGTDNYSTIDQVDYDLTLCTSNTRLGRGLALAECAAGDDLECVRKNPKQINVNLSAGADFAEIFPTCIDFDSGDPTLGAGMMGSYACKCS